MSLRDDLAYAMGRGGTGHVDALVAAGVSRDILFGGFLGLFGTCPITFSDDGIFEPAEVGPEAWVFPTEFYEVVDLVAWLPSNPRRWWLRRGATDFMNFEGVARVAFFAEPLVVYESALAWLRARGRGTVILNDKALLSFWFAGVPEIRAASVGLGRQIQNRLREPAPPRVLVPQEEAA